MEKTHVTTEKQVILVRTDLKMNAGKIGAQCAHASWLSVLNSSQRVGNKIIIDLNEKTKDWFDGSYGKIVLAVNSEDELKQLYQKALDVGLMASIVTDSGFTTFNYVPTLTAVCIGPDKSGKIDVITSHLKPLRKLIL